MISLMAGKIQVEKQLQNEIEFQCVYMDDALGAIRARQLWSEFASRVHLLENEAVHESYVVEGIRFESWCEHLGACIGRPSFSQWRAFKNTREGWTSLTLSLSRLGCCPWWSSRRSKMSGLLHFLAFPSVGRIDFLWSSGVKVFTPKSGKQLAAFSFPFKSSSKSLWVATWEPLLALCGDWSGFRRLGHMLALSLAKLGRLQPWMESLLDCVVWARFLTMGDGLIPCFSVGLLCLRFSKSKLTMRSGGIKSVAFVHVDNIIFIILSFFLMLDHFFSFFQQTTTKNNKKKQKKTKQTKKKQKIAKKSQNEQK